MYHKCKITVIKRMVNQELVDNYLKNPERISICNIVKDNQEFIITNPWEMPNNICPSAWADIRNYIMLMATGGEFKMMKDKNTIVASCTDLFRPVIFKIERI